MTTPDSPEGLTVEELARLKALAHGASPGPWRQAASVNNGDVYVKHQPGGFTLATTEANAAHIAAFDPPTALALITQVERLTAERDEAWKFYQVASESADIIEAADEMLLQQLDALEARADTLAAENAILRKSLEAFHDSATDATQGARQERDTLAAENERLSKIEKAAAFLASAENRAVERLSLERLRTALAAGDPAR